MGLLQQLSPLLVVQKEPQTMHKQVNVAIFQWNFIYKNAVGRILPAGCSLPTSERQVKCDW